MKYAVIGRHGEMKGEEVVDIEVVVQVEDGDDVAVGRAASEKLAQQAARENLERFREEQRIVNHPAVVAARDALAEAMRIVRAS